MPSTPRSTPSSRSEYQVQDIKKLNALHFVVMSENFAKELAFDIDLIVNTRDVAEGFPLMEYMR
jgi:hypothetical protein